MLRKVYISLDSYNKDEIEEIEKYNFLINKEAEEVFEKFYSKSNNVEENRKIMEYTTSLEYIMFVNYLLQKKWYDISLIDTLINSSLFIFNDKLYEIKNNEINELDIDNVWFFSLRWINWQHPFFFVLKSLIKSKWWFITKNNDCLQMTTRGKFYALSSLYKKNIWLIWNIIIPFNIKREQYEIFKNFIKNNFWDYILIKKDFYSCWEWNFPISLNNYDINQENKFKKAMDNNDSRIDAVYIVPIEKFIEEYRVYFTKVNWDILIHSVKKKNINIDLEEIVKMDVFRYWWYFDWNYVSIEQLKKEYKFIIKHSMKYLKNVSYNCWNLEFWKNINWEFRFFEVNTMWSVMPYKWEDTKNLIQYYNKLFENFI